MKKITIILIFALTAAACVEVYASDNKIINAINIVSKSPSFDCKKTTDAVEKLICSDDGLTELDIHMAEAYKVFQNSLDKDDLYNHQKLKDRQKNWLDNRGKVVCMNGTPKERQISCLSHIYETRIKRLTGWKERTDWTFFIEENVFNRGKTYKILSVNGEEYLLNLDGRSEDVWKCNLWLGLHTKAAVFPELPKEKIMYYSDVDYYDFCYDGGGPLSKIAILKQTEDTVIFASDNPSVQLPHGPREIKEFDVKVWETLAEKVDPVEAIEQFKRNYPDNLKLREKDAHTPEFCTIFADKIKSGDYELFLPVAEGNSYEELMSQYDTGCTKEEMLDYNWIGEDRENGVLKTVQKTSRIIPPYTLYVTNGGWYLAGGAYYAIRHRKDCSSSLFMAKDKGALVQVGNTVLSIEYHTRAGNNKFWNFSSFTPTQDKTIKAINCFYTNINK